MTITSFNVLADPWINVEYLDGHTAKIGAREAILNSHLIKDVLTPVFHNDEFCFNRAVVYSFLSAVIMAAANTKIDGDRADDISGKEYVRNLHILQETLDTEQVKSYLDFYNDYFDLFSKTRPFMQDIRLKPLIEKKTIKPTPHYALMLNPVAPGASTVRFGATRNIKWADGHAPEYDVTPDEMVYYLLYNASYASSVMPGKFAIALRGKEDLAVYLKGKTLKDTILLNCIWSRDKYIGHPFWEYDITDSDVWFESLFALNGYKDRAGKHSCDSLLLNEFYPLFKNVYVEPSLNEDGKFDRVYIPTNESIGALSCKNKEIVEEMKAYFNYISNAIHSVVLQRDDKFFYITLSSEPDLINDIVAVTKVLPDKNMTTKIIDGIANLEGGDFSIEYFCRIRNKQKVVTTTSYSVFYDKAKWLISANGAEILEQYSSLYKDMKYKLRRAVTIECHCGNVSKPNKTDEVNSPVYKSIEDPAISLFSARAEEYMKTLDWDADTDMVITNAEQYLYKTAMDIYSSVCRVKDMFSYAKGVQVLNSYHKDFNKPKEEKACQKRKPVAS